MTLLNHSRHLTTTLKLFRLGDRALCRTPIAVIGWLAAEPALCVELSTRAYVAQVAGLSRDHREIRSDNPVILLRVQAVFVMAKTSPVRSESLD